MTLFEVCWLCHITQLLALLIVNAKALLCEAKLVDCDHMSSYNKHAEAGSATAQAVASGDGSNGNERVNQRINNVNDVIAFLKAEQKLIIGSDALQKRDRVQMASSLTDVIAILSSRERYLGGSDENEVKQEIATEIIPLVTDSIE